MPLKLKTISLIIIYLSISYTRLTANIDTTTIYLIPGQGADHRLFNNLSLPNNYRVTHIKYITPEKGTSLPEYARFLTKQIDTTEKFILIGVSLGGMLATEMSTFISPEKVILISSAKHRNELPGSYKFQQKFPLYKIVSPRMSKLGARILQPIFEPDRRHEKEIFKNMLKDKDPDFLRRTIEMIMTWEREISPENIVHIHGKKDNTVPIRNVKYDYLVAKGSHMMTLTRGEEISELISTILLDNKQ